MAENIFKQLSNIDISKLVQKKDNFSYLSWMASLALASAEHDVAYEVWRDPNTHLPYTYDPAMGYMVYTLVTIKGETKPMWMPVLDHANKPMKAEEYKYTKKKWVSGKKVEVTATCEAATMWDINRSIMRCLAKNLAVFGLGYSVYVNEDIADLLAATDEASEKKPAEEGTPAKATKATKPPLNTKHANWPQVEKYVSDNRGVGIETIISQLERKYTLGPNTLKRVKLIHAKVEGGASE